MDGGWNSWIGKKVFIILKNKRTYTGKVIRIDESPHLIFITIRDKYDKEVMFVQGEIEVMQEEE
jgi:small nuclear ribonucleoprotein (snRNP)-like protein